MIHYDGGNSDETIVAAANENPFVELQHNTKEKILEDLVTMPKSCRKTILIYGMPGLGKTTIANKLYDCSSTFHYFDRRVWCVVSQTYSERSLLINILTHLAREMRKDDILKKTDAELGLDIHKNLKQRRYLIVLDDVWHSNVWYDLKIYLPDDGNGSRVVLTSRIKDAAPEGSIYHALPLFSEDQCWDLLEKKIFTRDSCPPELLNIGKGIAAKCYGIPLAVIVTAGILANLNKEECAWERVERHLDSYLLDDPSNYRKILELSYEHLPLNLKPCFLYFAAFPEGAEISVNKLVWRWIAEGFIREIEGKSREQTAESYLLDLMNRSLVILGRRGPDGGTKTCRIHDLLHDICVIKANEENFLNSNNELSIYEKHQRSYLPSTLNTDSRPFGLHCRSLIGGLPDRSTCFQTRALLKVLDIRPNRYQRYDGTCYDLPIQLRYLGVNHLTSAMVANLENLEVINVVNARQIKLPSVILKMKKLRHLIVKKEALFEDDGYITEQTNLKTLLYVCIEKSAAEEAILRSSLHLQKLKCKIGAGVYIFPDLSFLEELETLKMVFKARIKGVIQVANLNFPFSIKSLCLFNARLPWQKMSVIGKLPNLCVLKLETFAFVGYEWETSEGEFEKLRFLKISQTELKQWTSYCNHFPKLEHLVLERFSDMLEIPSDLGDIPTLQRIDVTYCLIQACLSAVQIEREQCENGNEELLINITTAYWTKEELVAMYEENMEKAKNVPVAEDECNYMFELSSIICSPDRDFFVRNDGEQINVNSLKGKTVGIYFSTFRLALCQLFTRKLERVYNVLKKYGHFEIVFVSNDKDVDEESFNAGLSKLPWLAIPLTDSNIRNKLDELFVVQRLPHLVILDENGKVLTDEGVRIIEEDGKNFVQEDEDEAMWNDTLESLLVSGSLDYVIDIHGSKTPVSSLAGKTTILFFSASWCPPCQIVLQNLKKTYQEINAKSSDSLEVIFISCFEDHLSSDEYFATMPWLALPFHDYRKEALVRLYKVHWIPLVVVVGPTGKTITVEGQDIINRYGAKAYPFTSERIKEIESENENDIMVESWPKEVRKEVHEHELGLVKRIRYICDGCDESGRDWSYCCEDCNFDLHPKCALGDDYKTEMSVSWPKNAMEEVHEPEEEATMNYSLESLFVTNSRDYVIDAHGEKIQVSDLVGKTIILFFAAHWCPPCQFVLPELLQKYEANNEKHQNSVEVIFVSSDKDGSSFDDFFAMMPWLAVPFHDDRIQSLNRLFNVKNIPMLVTIEPTGKTATSNVWELISYPGAEAYPFTYEWVQSQTKAQQMVIFWPKKVTNKLHEHELRLVKQILYDCDSCHEVGIDWSYKCEDCLFSLHPNCCLSDDNANVKEESEDEKKKTDTASGE